jgi:RNA polymerase sigma-70 factor (ECF subfamily)
MQTWEDRELAERVVDDGDEGAFRALYDRHTPRLLRFAFRLLGGSDLHSAEDVVQETWIRAARGLQSFQWRSRFDVWLQGVALNVAREVLRRRRDHLPLLSETDSPTRPQDTAGRVDLDRALGRLSDRCRAVLVLHDFEGYTHQEIAGLLGIAVGTAKSHLHDARCQLEKHLTEAPRITKGARDAGRVAREA